MDIVRNASFIVLLSANSLFVLLYGSLGVTGNSVITAAAVTLPLLLLAGRFSPAVPDYLFAAFVALVAASIIVNGVTAPSREYALLALSLAAYPACRALGPTFQPWLFVPALSAIVAVGTIATLWALFHNPIGYDKPPVLGLGEGATQFAVSTCLLILASRRTWWAYAVAMVPCIVLAAAMVRHPFVALAMALIALAIALGRYKQVAGILAALVVAMALGLATRPETASKLWTYVVQANDPNAPTLAPEMARNLPPPTVENACTKINIHNTAALRVSMWREAAGLIPSAGIVGSGLGSILSKSCFGTYPHNIFLQSAVEFGIAASILLALIVLFALIRIAPALAKDTTAQFAFAGLVFALSESLMSGSVSSIVLLMAFTGWAVSLSGRVAAPGAQPHTS